MQITIPTLQLDNFRPLGLPRASVGTCSSAFGSFILTGNFTRWAGLAGFIVNVDGEDHTVLSVTATEMVITPAYTGVATSNIPFTIYPYVFLRLYPTQSFTAESDFQIIQPSAPGNGNFYKQVCSSVITSTLYLPELQVESTTDAVNPGERAARYFAGFYRPDGSLIQPYYKFEQFSLMASPQVQTWAEIARYNSRGAPPPLNYDTYTKDQILKLFATGEFDVLPPLIFDGTTLYIPKASATQDGYLSKEDYQMFLEGGGMGVNQINTGTGLEGGPITDSGTISLKDVPGVAGLYSNPIMEVNAQGQIISITSGTGGPVDDIAPIITVGPDEMDLLSTSVTIFWTTDEDSDSQVDYGTSLGPPYDTTTDFSQTSPRTTDHSVPITGLLALTTYHYRVRSRDAMHNMVESGDFTFMTAAGPDMVAPNLSGESVAVTGTTAIITWNTDESSDSQVNWGTTGGYGTLTTPIVDLGGVTTGHSVTIGSLTPGQTYHYQCRSRDMSPAQNLGLSIGDHSFTTTPPDTTPPAISGEAVTGITDTEAYIGWNTTVEAGDTQVGYGLASGSYGTLSPSSPADTSPRVNVHSVHLTGLDPLTTYHYQCRSRDVAGNLGLSTVDHSFMTSAPVPADLLTSLVAYWKFDETSGDRADSKGTHTLTPSAAITAVPGKSGLGNALQFTGVDGIFLSTPSTTDLAMGAGVDYTIATWVQVADKGLAGNAVNKAQGTADEYVIGYNPGPDDRFSFTVAVVSGAYHTVLSTPAGPPAINTWYLIVAWHIAGDGTIHIQVDNNAPNVHALDEPPKIGADLLIVGSYAGYYSSWNGLVDEVAIWKGRILSASDILWLWNSGAGRPFSTW